MIQQRNFVTYLLLNIITCGIYRFHCLFIMSLHINSMVEDVGRSTDP